MNSTECLATHITLDVSTLLMFALAGGPVGAGGVAGLGGAAGP